LAGRRALAALVRLDGAWHLLLPWGMGCMGTRQRAVCIQEGLGGLGPQQEPPDVVRRLGERLGPRQIVQ
jgi:hypothetical protein